MRSWPANRQQIKSTEYPQKTPNPIPVVAIDAIDDVPADGAGSLADSSRSSPDWSSNKPTPSYWWSGRGQRGVSWLNCCRTPSLCSAWACAVAGKWWLHRDCANHPRAPRCLLQHSSGTSALRQNSALSLAGSFRAGKDLGLPAIISMWLENVTKDRISAKDQHLPDKFPLGCWHSHY